ncbi:MAG: 4-hydroxy-tetrahydrodipicolinate synthase [Paludibacteraceae bacterium]|nr:4-hydroxy-tetrahydrodipicolinate synthase [Paludibacteraceae bacterium]
MKPIKGLGTALITPFTATGEIDWPAFDRLLRLQIDGGVDFLVVLGTTAEAVTLTEDEKRQVSRFVVERTKGTETGLVLGIGGNCTAAVTETLRQWHDELLHYDAILSVCPFYNKPSQEGLYRHFIAVAEASPVPVILYNVPGRTGVNLLSETVMRLHQACPQRIVGIKEASGNMTQILHLLEERDRQGFSDTLSMLSGDDGLACSIMQAGGDGLISVLSNAWPEITGEIVHDCNSGQQERMQKMISLLFKEGSPAGIKTVLTQMRLIDNNLRLPLVPNSEAVQEEICAEMARL